MKTICAWCKKVLKEGDDLIESHGICDDCFRNHFPDCWEKKQIKKGWGLVQQAREILNKVKIEENQD